MVSPDEAAASAAVIVALQPNFPPGIDTKCCGVSAKRPDRAENSETCDEALAHAAAFREGSLNADEEVTRTSSDSVVNMGSCPKSRRLTARFLTGSPGLGKEGNTGQ